MAGQMDNPLDGRGSVGICTKAAELVAAARLDGPVSAWPDHGWPDPEDTDEDLGDEDWIVGIAREPSTDLAYRVTAPDAPCTWIEIAKVRGPKVARALADLLNVAYAAREDR